uniref:RNA exonuclease 4 n=1 Tax=Ditylum brightwellii TaxID=49249 RepID=A0A6U3UEZ7_9STRA|mmetsp:Transcript_40767/g.61065  ORF Transcript_40767/g.61065 Transcript_40767/m.61065 type:complete len:348 (+) Transcript_40767:151-1194(+)
MFISKKKRAEIRERRKKLPKDQKSNTKDNKKRPREDDEEEDEGQHVASSAELVDTKDKVTIVRIPDGLTGKVAKKFRKDARRKVIAEGGNKDSIKFVSKDGEEEEDEEEEEQPKKKKSKTQTKSFPRINDLLAKAEADKQAEKEAAARQAAEEKIPPEEKAKYVALDCEMVGIGTDGKTSCLARASLVDWYGNVLLDTFVLVPDRVTDFRTHVSGIKAKHIKETNQNAMTPKDCRMKVGAILKNKILVGHALRNDFAALMMNHPAADIRDTAKYKPFMVSRGRNGGKLRPRKLRDLTKQFLKRDIQVQGESHDSIDDAKAAMDLYKVVRVQWEKDIQSRLKGKNKKR